MILLNFKTFEESSGAKGLKLARIAYKIARATRRLIAVAPQLVDLALIARSIRIPTYAQHVDASPAGSFTGSVSLPGVKHAGAAGVIINHSEKKIRLIEAEAIIARASELGLDVVACANNIPEARALAALGPAMIAIEPPELIGTGVAVSKARPEIVTEAVKAIKAINSRVSVLCGAGVSSSEDVAKAFELGAEGVLIASAYVKAKDPAQLLKAMALAAPSKAVETQSS